MTATVTTEIDGNGVAYLTMNRPEVHNAFNEHMIAELISLLNSLINNRKYEY